MPVRAKVDYHRLKPVVSGPPKLNSFDEAIGPSSYRLEAIVVDSRPQNQEVPPRQPESGGDPPGALSRPGQAGGSPRGREGAVSF